MAADASVAGRRTRPRRGSSSSSGRRGWCRAARGGERRRWCVVLVVGGGIALHSFLSQKAAAPSIHGRRHYSNRLSLAEALCVHLTDLQPAPRMIVGFSPAAPGGLVVAPLLLSLVSSSMYQPAMHACMKRVVRGPAGSMVCHSILVCFSSTFALDGRRADGGYQRKKMMCDFRHTFRYTAVLSLDRSMCVGSIDI